MIHRVKMKNQDWNEWLEVEEMAQKGKTKDRMLGLTVCCG
jgi:hypothetical protein